MFERTLRGPYVRGTRGYSNEEDALIEAMFEDKKSDRKIAAALTALGKQRSMASVASRRAALGCETKKPVTPIPTNDAFLAAMRAAISKGKEKAEDGIIVDSRPFVGLRIHAEPRFSGCGSTGAMCADAGEDREWS